MFQQIFHFEHFKFKNSSLQVDYFNLVKLRELIPDLNEAIKSFVLHKILPATILENAVVAKALSSEVDLESEYISVLHDEVVIHARKLFKCEACKIDDPSQFHHECMTLSHEQLCQYVGNDCLMSINIYRVIDELRTRNVLHLFTHDFFKNGIDYDLFEMKLLM